MCGLEGNSQRRGSAVHEVEFTRLVGGAEQVSHVSTRSAAIREPGCPKPREQRPEGERRPDRRLCEIVHGMNRTIRGPSAVATGRGRRFQTLGPQLNAP